MNRETIFITGVGSEMQGVGRLSDGRAVFVPFAIPGETVDGNDVVAVYEAFARAKERALKGEGPSIIECKTYLPLARPLDR